MGLVKLFSRPPASLIRLPAGCFTVDRQGKVIASTLPQQFPAPLLQEIAAHTLATFREAIAAQLPMGEIIIRFASLKITARAMNGGAIIFLAPTTP